MRKLIFLPGLLLVAAIGASAYAGGYAPAHAAATEAGDTGAVRVIVRFRSESRRPDVLATTDERDVAALASRTGVALRPTRSIQTGLRVIEVGTLAAPGSVAAALAALRADPDVQYAELDQRRHAHALPDDPLFLGQSVQSGQWYMQNDGSTPSAVDAVGAWDIVTGSTGVVIAVLDTGVRYDHPDLMLAYGGGRLLPGYDFVSDTRVANDGDGRDGDASDPGDWVTTADVGKLPFSGCQASDSSWHGTRVSGIIGARSNNSLGVSGLTWSGWILPVRVLGKCGGADSDIVSAMLWAGGVPVSGAPANPYPARIINLSLGGGTSCPQSYQDAIGQLRTRGVLVVASVGNEGSLVETPANCPGVAGIAAIRHVGTKVGFSNLGPGVALAAPGGNCVYTGVGQPCLYSIATTTNFGTQAPATNGYTDQFNFNVGTSFSAPIVAGIAGLMVAVNGRLSTSQLIARLQEGATRPFPTSSDPTVPVCHVPTSASDLQAFECVCTTQTCGAGMANANGAVQAALRPVAAVAVPAIVAPGLNLELRGSGSGAACNHSVVSYSWAIVNGGATPPGIVGASTDTATVVAPSSGSFTIRLAITDDAGRQDSADVVIGPTSAVTSAPPTAGTVACPPTITVISPVAVAISPTAATVRAGGGTRAFTATVSNAPDASVNWFVNDVPGGEVTLGTISPAGLYAAPAVVPVPATVTIKAVSVVDPTRSASATVTITSQSTKGGSGGGGGAADPLALFLLLLAGAALARRPHGMRGWGTHFVG
jgi:serine protease